MENENVALIFETKTYNNICNDVFDYMLGFKSNDPVIQKNFNLKREHINKVIGYTEVIGRSLELDQDQAYTAQLAALLHDVGRFEQFKEHNTFNDSQSVNHAELGVKIIKEKGWLFELPDELQNVITKAVLYHSLISIPKNEADDVVLIAKIIRDADKLDILESSIKDYNLPPDKRNQMITYELDNTSLLSKNIVKSILAEKLPNKKDMKTVTDFKMMQMAFVFDINFKITYSICNSKQYLKRLFDTLPKSDMVFEVYRKTKIHVENQLI